MSNIEIVGGEYDFLGDEILGDDDGDDLDSLMGDDDDDGDGGDFFGAARLQGRSVRAQGSNPRMIRLAQANQIVRAARTKAARALALRKLENSAAVLRPRSYSEIRKTYAGFGGTAAEDVVAGGTVSITWRAVAPMRPNRLIIPATLAPSLSLTRLSVGMDNYLPTPQGIPCECFAQDGTAVDDDGTGFFKLPTLQVGLDLNMTFENFGTSTVRVRGAWLCSAAV